MPIKVHSYTDGIVRVRFDAVQFDAVQFDAVQLLETYRHLVLRRGPVPPAARPSQEEGEDVWEGDDSNWIIYSDCQRE